VSATRRLGRLATLLLSLAGCANDDWEFRPRDSGARPSDAARVDVVIPRDGTIGTDVARTDLGPIGTDVVIGSDVGFVDAGASDTGSVETDVATPDSGPPPTGLTLRAHGIASTAGAGAEGSLRLTETGFEFSDRTCASSLCLAGGLVP
jgi:hypothetical protein